METAMSSRPMSRHPGLFAPFLVLMITGRLLGQDPDPNAVPNNGQEVLTRGPVHEAFASPVVYDPKAGPVIPQAPPAPIQEMPPDQKPEGANVQWISGYWAWDDARRDYLWVSGVWRNIPPGREWVPGYWHEVPGGVQWVSGVWMTSQPQGGAAQYYPTPPASLEAGPNSPPPTPDSVWAPGCWLWQETRYVWRPGFWVAPQPNWVWVPAQYYWTPNGYVFTEGYWDRPIAVRGQMFAPVYFNQPVYAQAAFVYRPTIGIVATGLLASLFVRPTFGVYYFGDYYAPSYFGVGIYPAYSFHQSRFGYDPLFSYYSVTYRQTNPNWAIQVRESYIYRRDHIDARPPATYAEMVRVNRNVTINNTTIINNNVRNVSFAAPIHQLAASNATAMRFERIDAAQQKVIAAQAQQLHQFREQRIQQESVAARGRPAGEMTRPRPMELPRSPVAVAHNAPAQASHVPASAPHQGPPAAPAHPALDHGAQPRAVEHGALRPDPHPAAEHGPQGVPHPAAGHPVPQKPVTREASKTTHKK
jgi:hypothetical protein